MYIGKEVGYEFVMIVWGSGYCEKYNLFFVMLQCIGDEELFGVYGVV